MDDRTLEEQLAHCDGRDCTCAAFGQCECACAADWTPAEVYRLRHRLAAAEALVVEWRKDDAAHLDRYGQHHPADLRTMADLLDAALAATAVHGSAETLTQGGGIADSVNPEMSNVAGQVRPESNKAPEP